MPYSGPVSSGATPVHTAEKPANTRAWYRQERRSPGSVRSRRSGSARRQHLRVLHATGPVTRARDGRRVLYRRSPLGERLARHGGF